MTTACATNNGVAAPNTSCTPRVAVIDGSASSRGATQQTQAAELITSIAVSSAICGLAAEAFIVTGPGTVAPLLTREDLADLTPTGPNQTIRAARFSDSDTAQIRDLIDRRLADAYRSLPATQSSIVAMLAVAADHMSPETHIIIVTDGVNDDDLLSLNRPLHPGEGASLAQQLPTPTLQASKVTFVGVGLVDTTAPIPNPNWEIEIRAFIQNVCEQSTTAECEVLGTFSISGLLQ